MRFLFQQLGENLAALTPEPHQGHPFRRGRTACHYVSTTVTNPAEHPVPSRASPAEVARAADWTHRSRYVRILLKRSEIFVHEAAGGCLRAYFACQLCAFQALREETCRPVDAVGS